MLRCQHQHDGDDTSQALCRFEQLANELLADSTLAGQEGTLQYLAASAALQQWGQAALALLVLGRAGSALSEPELQQQAEELAGGTFPGMCNIFGRVETSCLPGEPGSLARCQMRVFWAQVEEDKDLSCSSRLRSCWRNTSRGP